MLPRLAGGIDKGASMTDRWASFIAPDESLEGQEHPHLALNVPIRSGYQAYEHMYEHLGHDPRFDALVAQVRRVDLIYEDQCSSKYYFDLFRVLNVLSGQYNRVAEVGVFMGGSALVFAGAMEHFDFDLDLIDISPEHLRFTYERIRRTFPDAIGRVRLFYGGLPEYAKAVMTGFDPATVKTMIHHDGAHYFSQVVRDLAALSFVRDAIHSIICQDTHLRGQVQGQTFVDAAIYAVFGPDFQFAPIGSEYDAGNTLLMTPNIYGGQYFLPDRPEGMVLPLESNTFYYPHASMIIDEFLDQERAAAAKAALGE